MLNGKHIERLSKNEHVIAAGVTWRWIDTVAKRMAEELPTVLHEVLEMASEEDLAGIDALREDMEREIRMNCSRFLNQV